MIQSTKNDDDTIIGRDDFEILVKKASHREKVNINF